MDNISSAFIFNKWSQVNHSFKLIIPVFISCYLLSTELCLTNNDIYLTLPQIGEAIGLELRLLEARFISNTRQSAHWIIPRLKF